MRKCKELIDEIIRTSKGRHKWIRNKIKHLEQIENPTILEKHELCVSYAILAWIPFSNRNEVFELCETCEHKVKSDDVFKAMGEDDRN